MSNIEKERAAFEAWWTKHGQYDRAGGGDYERTFAYNAWIARAEAAQPAPAPMQVGCEDDDGLQDEIDVLLELIFQSARYERPSTDARPALEAFALRLMAKAPQAAQRVLLTDAMVDDVMEFAEAYGDAREWRNEGTGDLRFAALREAVEELYRAAQRVPLTDAQILDAISEAGCPDPVEVTMSEYDIALARAIEAAHGITQRRLTDE